MKVRHVVTSFLANPKDDTVLLGRRSSRVSTYRGHWGAVSGSVEGKGPRRQAFREIEEETSLSPAQVELVGEGWPIRFPDWQLETLWVVHPYLFRCKAPGEVRPDWEHVRFEWVDAHTIPQLKTVPKLWDAYLSAKKAAESGGYYDSEQVFSLVRDDRERGADELGVWTLMGLKTAGREAASRCHSRRQMMLAMKGKCRTAACLRPSMAPPVSGALAAFGLFRDNISQQGGDLQRDAAAAMDGLEDVITARENAPLQVAQGARDFIPRQVRLVILSYSFTVLAALKQAADKISGLTVAESRPGCEGRKTARQAACFGIATQLVTDAAAASAVRDAEMVIIGADAVLSDGSIVNKTGTFSLCCAARFFGRRTLALTTQSKILPAGMTVQTEEMQPEELGEPIPGVRTRNPYFEQTPADLIDTIITESGLLDHDVLKAESNRLRAAYDELMR